MAAHSSVQICPSFSGPCAFEVYICRQVSARKDGKSRCISSNGGRGLSLLSTAEVPIILSKLRATSLHPHPAVTSWRAFSAVCFFSSVLNIFSFKTQACPSSDALPDSAAFWLVGTSLQGAAVMSVSTHASPKCNISLVARNHELQPCLGTGYRDSCCPIGPRE